MTHDEKKEQAADDFIGRSFKDDKGDVYKITGSLYHTNEVTKVESNHAWAYRDEKGFERWVEASPDDMRRRIAAVDPDLTGRWYDGVNNKRYIVGRDPDRPGNWITAAAPGEHLSSSGNASTEFLAARLCEAPINPKVLTGRLPSAQPNVSNEPRTDLAGLWYKSPYGHGYRRVLHPVMYRPRQWWVASYRNDGTDVDVFRKARQGDSFILANLCDPPDWATPSAAVESRALAEGYLSGPGGQGKSLLTSEAVRKGNEIHEAVAASLTVEPSGGSVPYMTHAWSPYIYAGSTVCQDCGEVGNKRERVTHVCECPGARTFVTTLENARARNQANADSERRPAERPTHQSAATSTDGLICSFGRRPKW